MHEHEAQSMNEAGSLKVDVALGSGGTAGTSQSWTPAVPWNSIPGELMAFVYLPSGAPSTLTGRLSIWDRQTATSGAATGTASAVLTPGSWTALRMPYAHVDPGTKVGKAAVEVSSPTGVTFTGSVYVDDVTVRGIVGDISDTTTPAVTVQRLSYDPDGRETTLGRLDDGSVFQDWVYAYTGAGMVTTITDPDTNQRQTPPDEFLHVPEVIEPGGSAATYSRGYFSDSNQLKTWANDLGETSQRGADVETGDTTFEMDSRNQKLAADGTAQFRARTYQRDSHGNVTSIQDNLYAIGADLDQGPMPAPVTTERNSDFTYTTYGTVATMTDPNGNVTAFTYQSGTGYLTKIAAPHGNAESGTRDTLITPNADGTPDTVVDPEGQTRAFTYDGLGRLTRIDYGVVSGTPAFSANYTLDDDGNLTAMTDDSGTSSWTHDDNDQLTAESRTPSGGTAKSVGYAYYANGQLHTLTTFESQTITFTYDALLRPATQTDPKDAGGTISFTHDARSRLIKTTYPSGAFEEVDYPAKGDHIESIKLKDSSSTTLHRYVYDYGIDQSGSRTAGYHAGKLLSVTELDGSVETYTYGATFNRLKTAVRTGTAPFYQAYTYDLDDNRTSIAYSSGGTPVTTTYDGANQVMSANGTSYSWDRNGNLVAYGSDTLSYDAADRWTSGTIGGHSVAYRYDGQGRRVRRTDDATATTDFWYDLRGMSYESGATGATYDLALDGTALSVSSGSTVNDIGHDRLRSTRTLVSSAQAITKSIAYDPWGLTTLSSGSPSVGLRWTGVYKDITTGLSRMAARFYQPATGRFSQLDPLPKSLLSVNRYAYAGCDPINATDRSGLDAGSSCTVFTALLEMSPVLGILGVAFSWTVSFPESLPPTPTALGLIAGLFGGATKFNDEMSTCDTSVW